VKLLDEDEQCPPPRVPVSDPFIESVLSELGPKHGLYGVEGWLRGHINRIEEKSSSLSKAIRLAVAWLEAGDQIPNPLRICKEHERILKEVGPVIEAKREAFREAAKELM